ncbi:MGT family glycosyltransferase [Microbacterium terrae]|uniref:4'-demethylrebeccamycin synthase n=1 Tax=Microbacterium terrae TaxID=69369 RepID=A0A0M2HFH1_9MICO|nr:nucleotide disphospho-sugar-binding domain-containing protein [Microbacterium terrae]KJL45409.1 4'-demethylrebeccamycin synthase [Microbacterium terrae]MBP1078720.1 MGT family glycosyltransferase [Microbacterium terrae]GLJ98121.1 glycosyl transferase [Microbacterium terrae]
MARFLFSAMPFTGHVQPVSAVAAALVARGHDVRIYTGHAFAGRVAASGARLVPWHHAPDFDENDLAATFPRLVGKKGLGQLLVNVQDVFIKTAPAQVRDLTEEFAREPWDAVAGDDVSLGAIFHSDLAVIPWATISVTPLNIVGTEGPPSGMGLAPGTNVFTKARDAALRALVPALSISLRRPLIDARAAAGLPPSKATLDQTLFSPRLIVASGCRLLDYDRGDRPPHLHFVGRLTAPAAAGAPLPLPPWWGDLAGRRVVHITQGTQNIDPSDLLQPAIEALADSDALVVAVTGVAGRDELPFPVPANVRVAGFIPYDALLPLTDIVITNGGWGGTLAALSHGIPLVIGGGDLDKPEIASRVTWAGAGVNLKTGTPTAAQVRAGHDRVVADRSFRDAAARVGAQLTALGGPAVAAELLETLV